MTTRRDFLRTSGLISLGLIVGDEALELMARLTHRRTMWAGVDDPKWRKVQGPLIQTWAKAPPGYVFVGSTFVFDDWAGLVKGVKSRLAL